MHAWELVYQFTWLDTSQDGPGRRPGVFWVSGHRHGISLKYSDIGVTYGQVNVSSLHSPRKEHKIVCGESTSTNLEKLRSIKSIQNTKFSAVVHYNDLLRAIYYIFLLVSSLLLNSECRSIKLFCSLAFWCHLVLRLKHVVQQKVTSQQWVYVKVTENNN